MPDTDPFRQWNPHRLTKGSRSPSWYGDRLVRALGERLCAFRSEDSHECLGRLVVDHDHDCNKEHSAQLACRSCVRGFLCLRGNMEMGVYDAQARKFGDAYLPPYVAEYRRSRPLFA